MAITARVIRNLCMLTTCACINMPSKHGGSAMLYSKHRFKMLYRQLVVLLILLSIYIKYISNTFNRLRNTFHVEQIKEKEYLRDSSLHKLNTAVHVSKHW